MTKVRYEDLSGRMVDELNAKNKVSQRPELLNEVKTTAKTVRAFLDELNNVDSNLVEAFRHRSICMGLADLSSEADAEAAHILTHKQEIETALSLIPMIPPNELTGPFDETEARKRCMRQLFGEEVTLSDDEGDYKAGLSLKHPAFKNAVLGYLRCESRSKSGGSIANNGTLTLHLAALERALNQSGLSAEQRTELWRPIEACRGAVRENYRRYPSNTDAWLMGED